MVQQRADHLCCGPDNSIDPPLRCRWSAGAECAGSVVVGRSCSSSMPRAASASFLPELTDLSEMFLGHCRSLRADYPSSDPWCAASPAQLVRCCVRLFPHSTALAFFRWLNSALFSPQNASKANHFIHFREDLFSWRCRRRTPCTAAAYRLISVSLNSPSPCPCDALLASLSATY